MAFWSSKKVTYSVVEFAKQFHPHPFAQKRLDLMELESPLYHFLLLLLSYFFDARKGFKRSFGIMESPFFDRI